ncbi:PREDICTED: serine carboxypeptidase-like 20 isoform X1 [Brassica oleracea var. oleracea]|uniref:serine carboxypeptidase-like 20 isoform X1 n=1 Tax=Brassica oleracea var. oleracea TaxID=109376 RepID=UPI0006A6DFEE|nr:PREDICTED: serine carboxypeptidase-like 20 isoform X1 [Brassica oleracea var. oleracea]
MRFLLKVLAFVTLLLVFLITTESAPESALITKLPGFSGTFPSKHYSGYVTIDKEHGKNLWYYFVESEMNPSKDPVVLWLNGGPGCSSMDGFVYEHGPFNFEPAKTNYSLPLLHLNPYSWSKVSNMIYLDSPVGVGFSYSKNESDYITGDMKTAVDSHAFLLKWFQMFPEFQSNPFYISGESYAGVYVPTLASEVVKGNKEGLKPALNLKGYLVGNGVADSMYDGNALIPFAHGMGLISDQLFEHVTKACNGNFYDNFSPDCEEQMAKVSMDIDRLNIYNILEPCYHGTSLSAFDIKSLPSTLLQLGKIEKPLAVRKRMFGRAWPVRAPILPGIVPSWSQLLADVSVPCIDDRVATAWLNDPAIRKAIHAKEVSNSVLILLLYYIKKILLMCLKILQESEIGRWVLCTGKLSFHHDAGSMISFHRNLTLSGYRALIYSGDHDMCVPFTGSEAWTHSLGYKVIDEWRAWISNDQVAGYTEGYANNLTVLTIKGAGHTVPEYKPREALDFYSRFLAGSKI